MFIHEGDVITSQLYLDNYFNEYQETLSVTITLINEIDRDV